MEEFQNDGIRVTEPRTEHCREKIFEREKNNRWKDNLEKWNKKNRELEELERRYGTTVGTLPTEYVKSGKKIEKQGQREESV